MEKIILLVAEGQTDIIIFEAIANHLSNPLVNFLFIPLAPQKDATSGTYPAHGFGEVINWSRANRDKIQTLIDFKSASSLFIQMDTDIASQINKNCIELKKNHTICCKSPRICCEKNLNEALQSNSEPTRCSYILATQNTETWLLASHNNVTILDPTLKELKNYELITDTDQILISMGYSARKKTAGRKTLNKKQAEKRYKKYAQQLVENLNLARQRCQELDRLCNLITSYS
jgi:hypothetical protein